jgi:hypothetical protein
MKKKERRMRVWVDVSARGNVWEFFGGPTADKYPTLLRIHRKKITKELVMATLIYKI